MVQGYSVFARGNQKKKANIRITKVLESEQLRVFSLGLFCASEGWPVWMNFKQYVCFGVLGCTVKSQMAEWIIVGVWVHNFYVS